MVLIALCYLLFIHRTVFSQISENLEQELHKEQTPVTYEQGSEPMQHYGEYKESAILVLPLSVSFSVCLSRYFLSLFLPLMWMCVGGRNIHFIHMKSISGISKEHFAIDKFSIWIQYLIQTAIAFINIYTYSLSNNGKGNVRRWMENWTIVYINKTLSKWILIFDLDYFYCNNRD